eukprot:CAMPEP_0174279852 /NCGR_PEP_ID=MMETSP0809-20121228/130_1 /TAXON_ID=73025 ORGANISM="Eutreptiella gymnastica-like, Strain CCMP1594" /NCGR_SAMPLE_ID=MMETSP0809 /ASSEMBLY_ACC=CAM_ASM_000658 /LENGTH=71 /DNA_ID=CAMNT_0015372433 /DNA_START=167 /DNA_END=383 /DNA_ORIENTATION=+
MAVDTAAQPREWHVVLQKKRAEKAWLDHPVSGYCAGQLSVGTFLGQWLRAQTPDTKGPLMHYPNSECYEEQ